MAKYISTIVETKTSLSSKTKVGISLFLVAGAIAFAATPRLEKTQNLFQVNIKPDIAIKNVSVTSPDNDFRNISFDIVNQGSLDIRNDFDVNLMSNERNAQGAMLSEWIQSLRVGETRHFEHRIRFVPSIKIQVDISSNINELNENNNIFTRQTDLADLEIINTTKQPRQNGQILPSGFLWLDSVIRNSGNVPAQGVNVYVTNGRGWSGETTLQQPLLPGQQRLFHIELIPQQIHAGKIHRFVLSVDPLNTISEFNETNNRVNLEPIEFGSFKTAIIQFKMPNTEFREHYQGATTEIRNKNTIEIMNNRSRVWHSDMYTQQRRPDLDSDVHSLYSFDSWWREQRRLATGVDRDVFKSTIFGPYDLPQLPPNRNRGENCSGELEAFFQQYAGQNGIDTNLFDRVIYIFYDHIRDLGDPLDTSGDYEFIFDSCAIQNRSAFIGLLTLDNNDDKLMKVVLHESGHILGGVDRYLLRPPYCMNPEGIPEPNKQPLFPQTKACLMCETLIDNFTPGRDENNLDDTRPIKDITELTSCAHGERYIWP